MTDTAIDIRYFVLLNLYRAGYQYLIRTVRGTLLAYAEEGPQANTGLQIRDDYLLDFTMSWERPLNIEGELIKKGLR